MYLLFAILLPLFLLLFILNHWRRKKNIKKVRAMCLTDKCRLLNELLEPFGYSYILSQDIFTSRRDAWQREMGYCTLYDRAAYHLNMVFDSLPVYFVYQGRTWLLEFWKGQYGITTGGEIGLYYADRLLKENELETTLFQAVPDDKMLRMSFTLFKNDTPVTELSGVHWWLTAFRLGYFSQPGDLTLCASVDFPSPDMARAFVKGLYSAGYEPCNICCRCNTVTFSFDRTVRRKGLIRNLRIQMAQWSNRFWCRVYLFITRPFSTALDRVLYLYFYLPFAFRRTLRIRRYKKYKPGRNSRRNRRQSNSR